MIIYNVASLFNLKKEKAAFRNIMNWVSRNEEPPEVTLAKSITSVVTHILIEMENSTSPEEAIAKGEGYKVKEWSELAHMAICGKISVEDIMVKIRVLITEI